MKDQYDYLKGLSSPMLIEDVEFKQKTINKGGYMLVLPYKSARYDMQKLDDVCGLNWVNDYKLIDGELYCGIGIKDGNEWVWRWDLGVASSGMDDGNNKKGMASDAFKRAGFRWGIGRELYHWPIIQVKLNADEFVVENNKAKQTWNLRLNDWVWKIERNEDDSLKNIQASYNGVIRYQWGEFPIVKKDVTVEQFTQIHDMIIAGKLTKEKALANYNFNEDQLKLIENGK